VPRPRCMCCWMTFCPCIQFFRVLGFLYGKCCGWCGCICFTLCCLSNPLGIIFTLVFNGFCGCWISACTRYQLRKRLSIAGTIWDDILIHLCATSCARCQESSELSSAGYSGCMYEHSPSVDDDTVGSMALQSDIGRQRQPVTPIPPTSPAPETQRQALTSSLLGGDEAPVCRVEAHLTVQDPTIVGTISPTWTVDDHRRAAAVEHDHRSVGQQATAIN
jgi:Cys-rich protein (TIGR01571 family)